MKKTCIPKGVRLFDINVNETIASYQHNSAVLDACFSDDLHCFSSGLDGHVKMFDVSTKTESIIGHHDDAVKCLCYSTRSSLVVSGSWDKTVKAWDVRMKSDSNSSCVATVQQPGKVYTMDVSPDGSILVVGTHGRHVYIYDLKQSSKPIQILQRRESSLKHQTRCIRCNKDSTGYALGSIEGRVSIEYFDPSDEWQQKKYAFKCHKITQNSVDTLYPINAIAFHPKYGTFATGGCDGLVNIWDPTNKKRIFYTHKFPTSIASLSFNCDGTLLAIASSYTFEFGDIDHPDDEVYVRNVQEADVKPKPKNL